MIQFSVLQRAPKTVMGTIYIGNMQLRYDVSGGTAVTFSNGYTQVFLPDMRDVCLFVEAEALGYGRQIGCLIRDRILMHCLLADIEEAEPWHLVTGQFDCYHAHRVDMLVCILNQVQCQWNPSDDDKHALYLADTLLRGGGWDA